jgi:predicted transposase YdaD
VVDLQSKVIQAAREGRRNGERKIAKNMKIEGESVERIARLTGLSADEIRGL